MAFLNDGFSTIIGFLNVANPAVFKILEKTVTPPGMSGGGPIDITTMRNIALRTKSPKHLQQMDDMALTAAYDPDAYVVAFNSLINVNQEITVTFPDLSTLTFWGYLNEFKPQEHREGEQPLANLAIICTNVDDSGIETDPVFVAA